MTVTDEDVERALAACDDDTVAGPDMRAALESFAAARETDTAIGGSHVGRRRAGRVAHHGARIEVGEEVNILDDIDRALKLPVTDSMSEARAVAAVVAKRLLEAHVRQPGFLIHPPADCGICALLRELEDK